MKQKGRQTDRTPKKDKKRNKGRQNKGARQEYPTVGPQRTFYS